MDVNARLWPLLSLRVPSWGHVSGAPQSRGLMALSRPRAFPQRSAAPVRAGRSPRAPSASRSAPGPSVLCPPAGAWGARQRRLTRGRRESFQKAGESDLQDSRRLLRGPRRLTGQPWAFAASFACHYFWNILEQRKHARLLGTPAMSPASGGRGRSFLPTSSARGTDLGHGFGSHLRQRRPRPGVPGASPQGAGEEFVRCVI